MDILRSAYRCKMRFYVDRPDLETDVLWYFADEGAPTLGTPHSFGTRVWEVKQSDSPDIGEQNSPRPWRGGLPEVPLGPGQPCGTPLQWVAGLGDRASNAVLDANNPPMYPPCCPPPIRAIGGCYQGPGFPSADCCGADTYPEEFVWEFMGPAAGGLNIGDVVPGYKGAPPCLPEPDERFDAHSAPFEWFGDTVQLAFGCYTPADPPLPIIVVHKVADCSIPSAGSDYFPGSCVPLNRYAETFNVVGGPWPEGSFTWRLRT